MLWLGWTCLAFLASLTFSRGSEARDAEAGKGG